VPGLRVAGRTTAPAQGSSFAIEGSVRFVGERVRVLVRLVDNTGHTIWSERFECSAQEGHVAQEQIATSTAGALRAATG
jgi:TolB-like protein